ncbi:MAG TPA: metallophosphoesterase family protein [Stellaceae bacterium]|nr:metallophosphoesterase family protein [Stellaceae bacterium]
MPHIDAMTVDFTAARGEQGAAPAPPPGTRVYAVGDIHGRIDLLREMNRLIRADAEERRARRNVLVYLGDYVDRGLESRAVIDLFLDAPLPGFETVHLRGNHEDIMVRFLADISVGPNWFAFGGLETLASYGVAPPEPMISVAELERCQLELGRNLPRPHLKFLRRLRTSHCEGGYFYVHAGVRPGIALEAQSEDDLLWIRDDFLLSDEPHAKLVVHGHSIAAKPVVRANRIGIDTGAYATGRLTCLVAEGTGWAFLQT